MINLFKLFKKKHKKKHKVPFFAYNRYTKHPSYSFKKDKNKEYWNLTITKASITDGKENLKLERNPNLSRQDIKAYIVKELNKNKYRTFRFGDSKYKWKFIKKDNKRVKKLIKELKQKEKR